MMDNQCKSYTTELNTTRNTSSEVSKRSKRRLSLVYVDDDDGISNRVLYKIPRILNSNESRTVSPLMSCSDKDQEDSQIYDLRKVYSIAAPVSPISVSLKNPDDLEPVVSRNDAEDVQAQAPIPPWIHLSNALSRDVVKKVEENGSHFMHPYHIQQRKHLNRPQRTEHQHNQHNQHQYQQDGKKISDTFKNNDMFHNENSSSSTSERTSTPWSSVFIPINGSVLGIPDVGVIGVNNPVHRGIYSDLNVDVDADTGTNSDSDSASPETKKAIAAIRQANMSLSSSQCNGIGNGNGVGDDIEIGTSFQLPHQNELELELQSFPSPSYPDVCWNLLDSSPGDSPITTIVFMEPEEEQPQVDVSSLTASAGSSSYLLDADMDIGVVQEETSVMVAESESANANANANAAAAAGEKAEKAEKADSTTVFLCKEALKLIHAATCNCTNSQHTHTSSSSSSSSSTSTCSTSVSPRSNVSACNSTSENMSLLWVCCPSN
jgi:hypothetical protein